MSKKKKAKHLSDEYLHNVTPDTESDPSEDKPEDVFRHCPHCGGRTKLIENEGPLETCSHCGKSLLVTMQPPRKWKLELNADGRIRDVDTGEVFGNVPLSLVPLYGAADALLKGLRLAVHHLENPGIPITPASLDNLRSIIAKGETPS